MPDLSIIDLITPYVFRAVDVGMWHPALSVLAVHEHETAWSQEGVTIRGVVRLHHNVHPWFDPDTMTFGVNMDAEEVRPATDPARRSPWFDIRDTTIPFQLTAQRTVSPRAQTAVNNLTPVTNPTRVLINAYDPNPALPSDFPSTEFQLDLIINSAVLRPPFLRGAKRLPTGQLVADLENQEVRFTLPKIRLRLSQGPNAGDPLTASLLSLGAHSLDDPGDLLTAELITMNPPYAFIGSSDVVGFGFRSAVLDLSAGTTPPDILKQFGYDEAWTGLYLPEIRLFVAPNGARDLAVDAGVRNLLIGFGQSGGVTGDFELAVLHQGGGPLRVGARFYDVTGRDYPITWTGANTATVQLPERSRMVIDFDGGLAPVKITSSIDGAPAQQDQATHEIDLTQKSQIGISFTVDDSSTPKRTGSLTITATREAKLAPAPSGSQPQTQNPNVELATVLVTRSEIPVGSPRLVLLSETATSARIGVEGGASAKWKVANVSAGTATEINVNVAPGEGYLVEAELDGGATVNTFTAYYRYDHPKPESSPDYATVLGNSMTEPAPDEGAATPWKTGQHSMEALHSILKEASDTQQIKIKGYASYEGNNTPQSKIYNTDLAQRRANGLEKMVRRLMEGPLTGKSFQIDPAPAAEMTGWEQQDTKLENRKTFWKAVAEFPGGIQRGKTLIHGVVSRRAVQKGGNQQIVIPDPPRVQTAPEQPSFFRRLGAKVRIVRNQFVACEVSAQFNIQTASEEALTKQAGVANASLPAFQKMGQNPADGIIDLRLLVQIDDASNEVTVTGYFGADPADKDGIAMVEVPQGQEPSTAMNILGATCVFLPIIAMGTNAVANNGALAQLSVGVGAMTAVTAIAGLGWLKTQRVIWYGGEVKVVANSNAEWSATVLLDLETSIYIDNMPLDLIEIPRESPVSVRYKAIGLMLGDPAGLPFQFRPMFDSSKGYTIDVSKPGAVKVRPPLDKVLQILGARIAKNNPLILELDLGFAINLSVITIERAKVRATLYNDQPNGGVGVELTAFGASVDIPGAVRGRGYVEIGEGKFVGQIDITIVPVSVRIAAGIGIQQIDAAHGGPATGVIVTLDVSFPVAIPLGTSGLGIYGFIGLFAMHWKRDESDLQSDEASPALAWLQKVGGDPTNLNGWKAQANNWAFGVGALLGTMGSSVIFNLKGMFMLELPGPRLLLMMKANLLMPMPERKGTGEGQMMAVLDLDMGRQTLTIGIFVTFEVKFLLKIRIPVEAFFDFKETSNWHVYLGQYKDMVQADILQVFEGCGYLMISGNGIKNVADLPEVTGFAIATGLHVSFIWGSKAAGLYAELAAGFDAVVGFDPFRFAGILYVRGTLNLWIVEISAWAKLKVDMGEDANNNKVSLIAGEICGEVELLFFTISGCVDFKLGSDKPTPPVPALVKGVRLISRSPALVVGSGTDKPIDAGLGEASDVDHDTEQKKLPVVPIDAIPTIMMSSPPLFDGVQFKGADLNHTAGAPADGWVGKGDTFYKYQLKSVDLKAVDAGSALTSGTTPATWWESKIDKPLEAQLALLSWIPEATPKAIEYSKYLEEWVEEHWGTICSPVCPPSPVMWNFMREVVGPSPPGWWLDGRAWPDPPNTVRETPVDIWTKVTERWRSGNKKLDQLRGVVPAVVEAAAVLCPPTKPTSTKPTTKLAASDLGVSEPSWQSGVALSSVTGGRTRPFVDVVGVARGRKELDPLLLTPMSRLDIYRSLNAGLPVSRSAYTPLMPPPETTLTGLQSAATTPAPTEDRRCQSRVLAAPLFEDVWRASANPVTVREKYIKDQLAKRNYKPGPLMDAVVIHTGEIKDATLLLFVPRLVLTTNQLVVALLNASEQLLTQRVVTTNDTIPGVPVPAKWTDPSGPWQEEMFRLLQHQKLLEQRGYLGVVIKIEGLSTADRIQIGLKPTAVKMLKEFAHRPFYLAAVEALRMSEVWRYDYEVKEQGKKKDIAGAVLGADTDDHALMLPNKLYEVTVTWDGYRERRPKGEAAQDVSGAVPGSMKYYFRTDAEAPKRLDPWVLASMPTEGEQHYFADDGMRLVFGTNNVVRLFEAYNKRLQIRLKASSYRAVPNLPNAPHPLILIQDVSVEPVAESVLSPFEEALGNLFENKLNPSCVPVEHSRKKHSKVDIKSPLDLFTDYVLDVEMLDKNAPESAVGTPIWRRSFSTGAFRSVQQFARSFFTARVEHKFVAPGVLQTIGTDFAGKDPVGNELDQRLIDAGLEPPEVPNRPRLVIYWQQPAGSPPPPPQPAALIIDSSEPLWRSRRLPVSAPDDTVPAGKRWELTDVPWLEPDQHLPGNPPADPVVDQIVKAPGGQRALVTFHNNSRGKKLRLALRQLKHTEPYMDGPGNPDPDYHTIADTILDRAPWEETD